MGYIGRYNPRHYQEQGFTNILIALKSHSTWASKDVSNNIFVEDTNAVPEPEYESLYQDWIRAVVARYDMDGGPEDKAGLRAPILMYEIGSEFSSFEPEDVDQYIHMLQLAYNATKSVNTNVQIAHAAFLVTPVDFEAVTTPLSTAAYTTLWDNTEFHDEHHLLDDMRTVLDNHAYFDLINVHNLGSPVELEGIKRWLDFETLQPGRERKSYIVSDTSPWPLIAWGRADLCGSGIFDFPDLQGLIIPPATEDDRCDLKDVFKDLLDGKSSTVAWARDVAAKDMIQRAIIAAEQGFALINLSFVADLDDLPPILALFFKLLWGGGAGLGQWGGALDVDMVFGGLQGEKRYPLFYALKQLMKYLNAYDNIARVSMVDTHARVYEVQKGGVKFWVCWRDPKGVILPNVTPQTTVTLQVGANTAFEEPVNTDGEETTLTPIPVTAEVATIVLEYTPKYIFTELPPTPAPQPAPAPTPGPICFSDANTVKTRDNGYVSMHRLQIGDYVRVSKKKFSRVYSFVHLDRDMEAEFIRIGTDSTGSTLEISSEHMVSVNGSYARAGKIRVGDVLGEGGYAVTRLDIVRRRGIYAPLTESGDLIVSGVHVSNYAALFDYSPLIQHAATHAFFAPQRMVCHIIFSVCMHETYTDGISDPSSVLGGTVALSLVGRSASVQITATVFASPLLATAFLLELLITSPLHLGLLSLGIMVYVKKTKKWVKTE